MGTYPDAAVERAMKIQEVLLRAMSGQISWVQAGRDYRAVGSADVARLEQSRGALGPSPRTRIGSR